MEKVLNQILETQNQILKTLQQHGEQLKTLEQGQTRLENKIDKLELRMENEVIDKVNALFDVREVQQDTNHQIISTLERIEAKVDVLQMETAHIRRVK